MENSSKPLKMVIVLAVAMSLLTLPGCEEQRLAGPCPAGTAEPDCSVCAVGNYCAGGDAALEPCPEGTWDHDASAASPCVNHRECLPGKYVVEAGSATENRVCLECSNGQFSETINAPSCNLWTTCIPGEQVKSEPSSVRDRECSACPNRTFSSTENVTACSTWTSCPAGTYVEAEGTPTLDRQCAVCPAGTFSYAENIPACEPWTDCPSGSYVLVDGSTTTDRTCAQCPPGETSTEPNSTSCMPDCSLGCLRVFVTSGRVTGYLLGGVAGADQWCQTIAGDRGLGGTWRAWISDDTSSPASRFTSREHSYRLLDGTLVAANWADLTDGALVHAINITEEGVYIAGTDGVWSNTSTDGQSAGGWDCLDWTSSSSNIEGGVGMAWRTDSWWTETGGVSYCNTPWRLYCFEDTN